MACSHAAKSLTKPPKVPHSPSPLLTQCSSRRSLPFAYVNLLCLPLLPLSLSLSQSHPYSPRPSSAQTRVVPPLSESPSPPLLSRPIERRRLSPFLPSFLPVAHPFKVCLRRHFQLPSARYMRDEAAQQTFCTAADSPMHCPLSSISSSSQGVLLTRTKSSASIEYVLAVRLARER